MTFQYNVWSVKASNEINKSVSFTRGVILHLWHGDTKKRYYLNRHIIIGKLNFNPDRDIHKNEDGIWELSAEREDLQKIIYRYFIARREEGTLRNTLSTIIRGFR